MSKNARAQALADRLSKAKKNKRAQQLGMEELRFLRTCSWDIESTNLQGNFGIILCSSVKALGGKVTTHRIDHTPGYQKHRWDDGHIAKQIRDELEKYQIVVGWNHVGFDLRFLNTRLIANGLCPLDVSSMCFVDLLWASRHRLRLHSNRLDSVIEYLGTSTHKTPLSGPLWLRAMTGDQKSLDKVVVHNVRDVECLEEVGEKLSRFVKLQYKLVK